MRRLSIVFGLFLGLGILISRIGLGPTLKVVGRLAVGWWSYLARVVPQVTVSGEGVLTGLLGLLLFTIGLHLFLRWFHGEILRAGGTISPSVVRWKPRWTVSMVAVVLLMFLAGMAAAGIAHQVGWLVNSRRPLLVPRLAGGTAWFGDSPQHLREIGLGMHNYVSVYESLPASKTDSQGRRLHSWQTAILPYLGFIANPGGQIHEDLPWDDPRNSAYFRGIVPAYLNPEIGAIRSSEGYALSHYAGNVHLLGRKRNWRLEQITGQAASTIVAGEVSAGFKPWGDPENLRDPDLGINTSPEGLGSPSGSGANFVFLDGSVRFLTKTIDPDVLRKLSHPPQ